MGTGLPTGWGAAVIGLCVLAAAIGGPGAVSASIHDDLRCDYPLTVTDAIGTEVTVEEEPERIVTLAPSAAQTIWRIGAREKVVGLSMHASFLEGASARTNVSADPLSTELETVVALEPDLVLAPNVTSRAEVEDLREQGLTVVYFETASSVDDVIDKTATIGQLVGACEGTAATIEEMVTTLERIQATVPPEDERPLVYYTLGAGYTPGAGTFQSDAIQRAGLRNLAVEAGLEGWSQLSEEVVIDRDPDWIAYSDSFPSPPVSDPLSDVSAMQQGQVVALEASAISQPSPALLDAIETLHEAVYSDLATPTSTPTETPTDAPHPTETHGSDGIPGFGLPVAVFAGLTAALLLVRRRYG